MSSCAILFVSQGANILLNLFFGPIANAANGIAYQVMGAVRQFSSSFQSAINPRIVKLYAKRNNEEMLQLCSLGARFSFYLFLIVCLPLCFVIAKEDSIKKTEKKKRKTSLHKKECVYLFL